MPHRRIHRIFAPALLTLVPAAALAPPGEVTLHGSVPRPSSDGGICQQIVLADLDGDGLTDVVGSMGYISIWRQLHGGTLTPLLLPDTLEYGTVAVADLDGDGSPSILVCLPSGITAFDFTAPGVPELKAVLTAPDDGGGELIAEAADLDGDGHPDVLANADSGGLRAWLGDGAGGLLPSKLASSVSAWRTHLGDLDLDGTLDVVGFSTAQRVAVPLLGHGDGTFIAQPAVPLPGLVREIALGHLDGDAYLDAAIATDGGTQLLLGTGGGFVPWTVVADDPQSVALGDTDGDGDDDLIEAVDASVVVHRVGPAGLGDAGQFSVRGGWLDVALAHLDGDAAATVLASSSSSFFSDLTLADCGPDGLPALEQSFATGSMPVAVADVDGDGQAELVGWESSGQIVVHKIPGDGTIGPALPGPPLIALPEARVIDLDGNAAQDLLLGRHVYGDMEWHPWRSNGDGTFTPGPTFTVYAVSAVGDLDGDGDEDLLSNGSTPEWLANLGDGSFGPPQAVTAPALHGYDWITLADADGDGLAELFQGWTLFGKNLREWKNLGAGNFAAPVVLDNKPHSPPLAMDLDGDGSVDLVTDGPASGGAGSPPSLVVLHGLGNDSFSPAVVYPASGVPAGSPPLPAIDFDGDGRSDLFAFDSASHRMTLMPQASDGSFGEGEELPFVIAYPYLCFAADVDGDGTPDLLSSNLDVSGHPAPGVRVSRVRQARGALDLGNATDDVGTAGTPQLDANGDLIPGGEVHLRLQAAPATAPLLLVLGLQTSYAPVISMAFAPPKTLGTMVPAAQLVFAGLASDAHGELSLKGRWPADAPPGLSVYAQAWMRNPADNLPLGSNALELGGD